MSPPKLKDLNFKKEFILGIKDEEIRKERERWEIGNA